MYIENVTVPFVENGIGLTYHPSLMSYPYGRRRKRRTGTGINCIAGLAARSAVRAFKMYTIMLFIRCYKGNNLWEVAINIST